MVLLNSTRRALLGLQLPGCGAALEQLTRAFGATSASSQQAQPASDSMEVFVNEQPVSIPKGSTVLQACDAAGVDIPRWEAWRRWSPPR